ncbi:DnaD domain protein [Subdoligranulum sp. DSM 109015]|uniref:DnaD domain protein n=1 Tax=Gemmiger gallinarum TaxID=2779354 RepID=A0ABR9R2E4_9FIRM|nr:DnaD domain protein [Gemmiger gallinarum]MBE5037298.1 DnaD domain protein [Gemmiger gallinarum]
MANEYVKLWLSYEAYFQPLSDAEVGRLARAMLQFKSHGVEPVFSGNERFVWPAIKRDLEQAISARESFLEKQRENGKKGGRPKSTQAFSEKPTETQKTQAFFEKPKKAKDKGQRTKDKGNVVSNETTTPHTPQGDVWEVDADLGIVADYYQKNIGTLAPSTYQQIQEWLSCLPADVLILAMRAAVDQGKRNWAYIKGILKRCADTGIKSKADWEAAENARNRPVKPYEGKRSPMEEKRAKLRQIAGGEIYEN